MPSPFPHPVPIRPSWGLPSLAFAPRVAAAARVVSASASALSASAAALVSLLPRGRSFSRHTRSADLTVKTALALRSLHYLTEAATSIVLDYLERCDNTQCIAVAVQLCDYDQSGLCAFALETFGHLNPQGHENWTICMLTT